MIRSFLNIASGQLAASDKVLRDNSADLPKQDHANHIGSDLVFVGWCLDVITSERNKGRVWRIRHCKISITPAAALGLERR